jgi:hypothetical protein
MVFSDHVIDTAGSPDVWITEDLDQDPEGNTAPLSIRVVWKVSRWNCGLLMVDVEAVDRIQDGAASGRSHSIPDSVPEDHLEEMKAQIHLHLASEYSRDQRVRFRQFDETLEVDIPGEGDQ